MGSTRRSTPFFSRWHLFGWYTWGPQTKRWLEYLGFLIGWCTWGFKILGLLGFLYCWYTFFGMSWNPPVLRMGSWVPKVFDMLILGFSDMGHNSTWWNSDHPQNKRNTVPLIRGIVG